jgi:hypothetical protein
MRESRKMDAQKIVDEIAGHVGGGPYSGWYAGIATDADDCLFNRHNVDKAKGRWIYRPADSNRAARAAEDALHRAGFDGGPGGGTEKTKTVYAYKKTASTSED